MFYRLFAYRSIRCQQAVSLDTAGSVQSVQFQTRWARLFADLEAQFDALEADELSIEVADRTRGELAAVTLANRLRAQVGRLVQLRMLGAGPVVGILTRVGADWATVASSTEPIELLVMLDCVTAAVDLPPQAVSDSGVDPLARRLGRGPVLRALARDRAPLQFRLRDASTVTGTPDRVGADFVDIAVHAVDQAPRLAEVRSRWTIAWDAIAVVQRVVSTGDR